MVEVKDPDVRTQKWGKIASVFNPFYICLAAVVNYSTVTVPTVDLIRPRV